MTRAIVCPDCGSYNLNQIKGSATAGPKNPKVNLIKPKKENIKYVCIDCGLEFYESDLRG